MNLTIEQAVQRVGVSELIIKKWIVAGKQDHSRTNNVIWIEAKNLQTAAGQDRREL